METPRNRLEGEFELHSNPHSRPISIPIADWRFRFDEPPNTADLINAFDGDLFRMLHLHAAEPFEALHELNIKAEAEAPESEVRPSESVVSGDRRETERHRPATSSAMIGWWRGSEFAVSNVVILNLGPGGMMINLEARPTRAQPVWLCLGEPKLESLAQARVLDTLKTPNGRYQVRLEFHSPCPSAFLEAAGKRMEA